MFARLESAAWLLDLAFFYKTAVLRPALEELECALLFDRFRSVAAVIAAGSQNFHEAGALHAPTELSDGCKRVFVAAFHYFGLDCHSQRRLP